MTDPYRERARGLLNPLASGDIGSIEWKATIDDITSALKEVEEETFARAVMAVEKLYERWPNGVVMGPDKTTIISVLREEAAKK